MKLNARIFVYDILNRDLFANQIDKIMDMNMILDQHFIVRPSNSSHFMSDSSNDDHNYSCELRLACNRSHNEDDPSHSSTFL